MENFILNTDIYQFLNSIQTQIEMETFGAPEQQTATNYKLGDDLKTHNKKREVDFNLSEQGEINQSSFNQNGQSQIQEPSIMKKISGPQANQNLEPEGNKSKAEFVSGYSFSRFQAISDEGAGTATGKFVQSTGSVWKKASKVPTSTKVISSNKLIEDPVEVKSFHQTQAMDRGQHQEKHGSTFQFTHLNQADLFEKFLKYSIQKGMDFKISENQATVIKRISILKSALGLCFPRNSQFQHQVYELSCVSQNSAKLTQSSGVNTLLFQSDSKYYQFREEFLVRLWTEKYLVSGSLHQNLRHFLRFANSISSQKSQSKFKKVGQVDQLKFQVEQTVKKLSQKYQKQQKNSKKSSSQIKSKQQFFEKINNPQLTKVKQKIKQMQQILKQLLQKQLKKQEKLKKLRSGSSKRIQFEIDQGEIISQQENMKTTVLLTPSMQRMLMNIFYLHLDLEEIIKRYVVSEKNICDFQKKKMIIKGSLNTADIFRYLQLQDFTKTLQSLSPQSQKELFSQSIKILSSLRFSTYPSPSQTIQVLQTLKTTLTKQIQNLNKLENNRHVKLQDHNNFDRTLLQFCIYCLIMCDNRDIYPTIETTILFGHSNELFDRKGLENWQEKAQINGQVKGYGSMSVILRKSISFVEHQWQI